MHFSFLSCRYLENVACTTPRPLVPTFACRLTAVEAGLSLTQREKIARGREREREEGESTPPAPAAVGEARSLLIDKVCDVARASYN